MHQTSHMKLGLPLQQHVQATNGRLLRNRRTRPVSLRDDELGNICKDKTPRRMPGKGCQRGAAGCTPQGWECVQYPCTADKVTYAEIKEQLDWPDETVGRGLHLLVSRESSVLRKEPDIMAIGKNDTFLLTTKYSGGQAYMSSFIVDVTTAGKEGRVP